jgi:HKD family nuclease
MISICKNIEQELIAQLANAKEIWIAVSMMNNGGYSLFKDLDSDIIQHHVVGVDLPTPPIILKNLKKKCSSSFSALVYESAYTFHPKVYIIKSQNDEFTAFVGSSNATTAGLTKNIELNICITDQVECSNLIYWFNNIKSQASLITDNFIEAYKTKYKEIKRREKKTTKDLNGIKKYSRVKEDQFFNSNHHEIFAPEYVEVENNDLKTIRKVVRDRLIELHNKIYPRFKDYNLTNLHPHHSKKDRVSKHFFTPYSGYYIESLWLHYGKSKEHLKRYEKSQQSFLNHARLQVIIHEKDVGIWLMLGIEDKGIIDRNHFRNQMNDIELRLKFYEKLKLLDKHYWIDFKGWHNRVFVKDIESVTQLHELLNQESLNHYFIIGRFYNPNDDEISNQNIGITVLSEFKKLHPLYELMSSP